MAVRCPKRWHSEAKTFYRRLHDEYQFNADEQRLVHALCENLSVFWQASDQLATDGLTFQTSSGQIKQHPGVAITKQAWQAVLSGCRLLGICQPQEEKKAVGRPPGPGKKYLGGM